MGIFSRLTDIVNANVNALLDRAEDPEKLMRLIIQEMEDTLIEVRSAAVKTIAERKELERRQQTVEAEIAEWADRARLAISRDREDLAKAALVQKARLGQVQQEVERQRAMVEDILAKNAADVSQLEAKLAEARQRQQTIVQRQRSATNQARVRERLYDKRLTEAFQRMEQVERALDVAESRVEAHDIGRRRSLGDEFADLEADAAVESELAQLKARVAAGGRSGA
jgi:phage shock protein A